MSIQVRVRRDTGSNLGTVIPAGGEMAFNTTDSRLHMGDGSTTGGIPHLTFNDDIARYFSYNSTAGSSNTYTLALPFAPGSYTAGMVINFKASFSNTGSATINVNSLGAKTFKKVLAGVLSNLASGDIISGNCYTAMYDGTNFQLFGFEMGGQTPGYKLLGAITASNSATMDFTSLMSSTYNSYELIWSDLRPATDNVSLYMYSSTNNGSSFDSDFMYQSYIQKLASSDTLATPTYAGPVSNGVLILNRTTSGLSSDVSGIGNAAAEGCSGWMRIANAPGTTRPKPIEFVNQFTDRNGAQAIIWGNGMRNAVTDIDAFRLAFSGGNITTGTGRLYGKIA